MRHPAKYSEALLPSLGAWAAGCRKILDPFGGTGKVGLLRDHGVPSEARIATVEIEPEWGAAPAPGVDTRVVGDATALPFATESFDAIITSPCYGNRMADRYLPPSGSPWTYRTYACALGRRPSPRSAGGMQWGPDYRALHGQAWREAWRVLEPGGRLVLNISDHVRGGEVVPVTDWHVQTLEHLGFQVAHHGVSVTTPRMRHGRNRELRVAGESVIVFGKPAAVGAPVPAELVRLGVRVARLQAARELEGSAVRVLREAGRDRYREALVRRDLVREALDLAHRRGWHPDQLDAFVESPRARRRLTPSKAIARRYACDRPPGSALVVGALLCALPELGLAADGGDDELAALFRELLLAPPVVEDFADDLAELEAAEMFSEAAELWGAE